MKDHEEHFFDAEALDSRSGAAGFVTLIVFGVLATFVLGFMAGSVRVQTAAEGGHDSFLDRAGAVVSKTLEDALGGEREPVFEVPLAPSSAVSGGRNASLETASAKEFSPAAFVVGETPENQKLSAAAARLNAPDAFVAPEIAADRVQSGTAAAAAPTCAFVRVMNPTREVLMNEIAWMGSTGSQPSQSSGGQAPQVGSGSSADEWIELKNVSTRNLNLAGWQIIDEKGNFKIVFGGEEIFSANSFLLLERTDDMSVPNVPADAIYTGALPNGGMFLELVNRECQVVDEVDASQSWPGGDNATKQTLERNASGFGWHTSTASGGTPRAENSAGVTATPPPSSAASYSVTVSKSGTGAGSVVSSPLGVNCGLDCSENFVGGALVTLTATPEPQSTFEGWTGVCTGKENCTIDVSGALSVGALFGGGIIFSQPSLPTAVPPPSSGAEAPSNILIIEVQTSGGAGKSENDYIKLWNPSGEARDVSGWKLRKRTQSGTETSIRVFPAGNIIAAGGYFLWANSSDGFSAAVGANVSSTATIADNASIALQDPNGAVQDAVAWGSGHVNPFVEGVPYPTNPVAPQLLRRIQQNGTFQDTGSNASDFILQ